MELLSEIFLSYIKFLFLSLVVACFQFYIIFMLVKFLVISSSTLISGFFFVSFNWDWYHMLYVDIVIVMHLIIYMKDFPLSSHFIHTQKTARLIQVHFIIFIKLISPWLASIALCLSLANLTCKPSFDDDECSWINICVCERVSEWEREEKNNKCKSKVFRGYEVIEVHCSLIYGDFFEHVFNNSLHWVRNKCSYFVKLQWNDCTLITAWHFSKKINSSMRKISSCQQS